MAKYNIPDAAKQLLDFIGSVETGKTDGYDVIFGHNEDKLTKPITRMTMDELIHHQRGFTNSFGSSASGKYQFMRATLLDLKSQYGFTGKEIMDRDFQDWLGYLLLKRRGFIKFMSGAIGKIEFGLNLAKEWASFPVLKSTKGRHRNVSRGQSYYSGDKYNKSLVAPERVEAVLDSILVAPGPTNKVPAPIAKPEIPDNIEEKLDQIDKPAEKSTTNWAAGLLSVLSAIIAAFSGLHPVVQGIAIVAAIGFGVWIIRERKKKTAIARDIREWIE